MLCWKDPSWQSPARPAQWPEFPELRSDTALRRSTLRLRFQAFLTSNESPSLGSLARLSGVARAQAEAGEDVRIMSGLEEILEELSPIEDYSENMSLTLSEPRFDDVKSTIDEAKDKDINYAAPLYVTAEFTNSMSGEIKSQTVFIGDFPMMTDKGTFIILSLIHI